MRELVMGLVVGLLAGFMIWGGVRAPSGGAAPEPAPAPVEPVRRAPTLEAPPIPAHSAAATPTEEKAPADRSAVFRSASRAELDAAFAQHKRASDAEAAALIERTQEAQRRKDLLSFKRLIHVLGQTGHPAAHAYLVALAADVEADLPENFADLVKPYLLVTEVPGVVEAAQARIEAADPNATAPWADVVVARGSDADVEALLRRSDSVRPQPIYEQLMSRPLDEARAYLARAERHGHPLVNSFYILRRFVEAHPEEGRALLLEGIRAFDGGAAQWRTLKADAYGRMLLVAYTAARSGVEEWPETAALLAGLRDERMRLDALLAVRTLAPYRGLDTSLLGDLLDQPARSLRAIIDSKPPPANAGQRLYSIAYLLSNALHARFLVTEENVTALEDATARWQGERKEELQRMARQCRAWLVEENWR